MLQLANPKVAQPKLVSFQPRLCHGALTVQQGCHIVSEKQSAKKKKKPLTIKTNIFMRNGTYSFLFTEKVYNNLYSCCISMIYEYGHVWNGHRMLVTYIHNVEHRNLEIRKHVTTSLFGYETFLLLLSWRFRHEERDTFFLCWLLRLAPISCGTHGTQIRLVSASPKSRTPSVRGLVSTLWLSSKSPKSSARFRCMTSPALCHPFLYLRLLWHLWVTCPLCAPTRVTTCIKVAPN